MNNSLYIVYILTNKYNKVLYTGFTDNLYRRVKEHREKMNKRSFTSRYNVHKLVYFEEVSDLEYAKFREHQIKAGSRQKKIDLINKNNPRWIDLFETLKDFG